MTFRTFIELPASIFFIAGMGCLPGCQWVREHRDPVVAECREFKIRVSDLHRTLARVHPSHSGHLSSPRGRERLLDITIEKTITMRAALAMARKEDPARAAPLTELEEQQLIYGFWKEWDKQQPQPSRAELKDFYIQNIGLFFTLPRIRWNVYRYSSLETAGRHEQILLKAGKGRAKVESFIEASENVPASVRPTLLSLKPGERSEVFQKEGDWIILERLEDYPPAVISFERAAESVKAELAKQRHKTWLEQQRETLKIVINTNHLKHARLRP